MPLDPLPAQGSLSWYSWAQSLQNTVALTIRTIAASGTLQASDGWLRVDSTSAVTVTVPANATVSIPAGTMMQVRRHGTGTVTLAAAAGVTLNGSGSGVPQFASYALVKIATDTWDVEGGI